jgi:hypothetical protein
MILNSLFFPSILFRSSSENESEHSDSEIRWSDYSDSEILPSVSSSEDESENPVYLSSECFPGDTWVVCEHEERLSDAGNGFIGPCQPVQSDAFYWCILVIERFGLCHVKRARRRHQSCANAADQASAF